MDNILSKKGYIIKKEYNKDIINIKKDLTVSPQNVFKGVEPESFEVFTEDENTIIVPKFYGIKKYGIPKINEEYDGVTVDLKFNGKLKEKQILIMNKVLPEFNKLNGGLLSLGCGEGKCLGYNTKVIMFDGRIKYVQDINVGDKLMGDNSEPRTVLSITNGIDKLYKVNDNNTGETYIVNKSHILSLKCVSNIPIKYNIFRCF